MRWSLPSSSPRPCSPRSLRCARSCPRSPRGLVAVAAAGRPPAGSGEVDAATGKPPCTHVDKAAAAHQDFEVRLSGLAFTERWGRARERLRARGGERRNAAGGGLFDAAPPAPRAPTCASRAGGGPSCLLRVQRPPRARAAGLEAALVESGISLQRARSRAVGRARRRAGGRAHREAAWLTELPPPVTADRAGAGFARQAGPAGPVDPSGGCVLHCRLRRRGGQAAAASLWHPSTAQASTPKEGTGMARDPKDDRLQALALTRAQIEKQYGKGGLMRLGDEGASKRSSVFDGQHGAGHRAGIRRLPRGRVVEIYGPEGSGKTTVALTVAANAHSATAGSRRSSTRARPDPTYARSAGVWTSTTCWCRSPTRRAGLEITENAGAQRRGRRGGDRLGGPRSRRAPRSR